MNKRPDLKVVPGGAKNGTHPAPAASTTEKPGRDPRALNRLDWIALGLLAVVLLLAPLCAGQFPTPVRGSFAVDSLFGLSGGLGTPLLIALSAVAMIVLAWREFQRPVAIGAVPGVAGALVGLAVWSALSLARSQALYMSLNTLFSLLAALLLGGMVGRLTRDRNGFVALLLAILIGGSLVAGIGIREYLFKALPPPRGEGVTDWRTFATFTNPDFLAGYLLITLPITLAAFVATTERLAKLGLGLGLGLQSACLLLTGSRAGAGILLLTLLLWAALAFASRAASGRWKRIGVGLALVVVGALLASAPTLSRVVGRGGEASASSGTGAVAAVEATAASQSHSSAFRRWTWTGTVKMAKANPILGTGLGTFEVAYPRYAVTAYTAHAHNSYLQVVGEIGIPGLLFLLTAFAAATAFATHILFLFREQPEPIAETYAASNPSGFAAQLAFNSPRLLLVGLLTATLASLMHSLIDSDWYIVTTAFTLSAVLALLIAQARDLAPLATQKPRPLSQSMLGVGALLAVLLLWRAYSLGTARMEVAAGSQALMNRQGSAALAAYQSAAAADPLDPENYLDLAQLYHGAQQPKEELDALQTAVRVAPIGKTYYRLAQNYVRSGDLNKAIEAYDKARSLQPVNVQNLRALGDTLRKAGQNDRAGEAYRALERLETGPYGQVRAVPEVVETEFAYAHSGLADIAAEAGNPAETAKEDARAAAVLREFWQKHNQGMTQMIPPEKRQDVTQLYDKILTQWQEALAKQGAPGAEELPRVAAEQKQFRAEWEAEKAKAQPETGAAQ